MSHSSAKFDFKIESLNPIPAGGGGQFDPPVVFFLHNSKSIGPGFQVPQQRWG